MHKIIQNCKIVHKHARQAIKYQKEEEIFTSKGLGEGLLGFPQNLPLLQAKGDWRRLEES